MSTIAYFDTTLTIGNTMFTNQKTIYKHWDILQTLSQELPIFTKFLPSVTEVQKNAKTFLQFTNFDKEYTFRQNINNNSQNIYHS